VGNTYYDNNVGIGTTFVGGAGEAALSVMNGNVGIGTWVPAQLLDVKGTIRTTNFTMTGQTPLVGYVLTASDTSGDATWSSAGGLEGWTVSGGNVYTTVGSNNVGIGTTTPQGGLVVTNGNVGIGTWAPGSALIVQNGNVGIGTTAAVYALQVYGTTGSVFNTNAPYTYTNSFVMGGDTGTQNSKVAAITLKRFYYDPTGYAAEMAFYRDGGASGGQIAFSTNPDSGTGNLPIERVRITASGNVGIGSWGSNSQNNTFSVVGNIGIGTNQSSSFIQTSAPNGGMIVQGNVGIGSLTPGQVLDVTGTVRMTGFTMSSQSPLVGYVLTASDTAGDATWSSAGGIAGWTVSGGNVYTTTGSNNVGIGTSIPGGGLVVMNGNVGIGTWLPSAALNVMSGNVGIGTWVTSSTLSIQGSMASAVVTKTGAYLASANDYVILVNANSGSVTITLPAVASVPGREYIIKKIDSSANSVIIQANASELIDGQNSVTTTLQYQSYTIVSDGTQWDII